MQASGSDGREAAGCEQRRLRAASAASIACEQVIVHTEHTLGASPEVCFYATKLFLYHLLTAL